MMQDLMDRFVAWASEQPNLRGGAVLGSHARTQTPADTLSDLDLVVAVQDPSVYLSEVAWLRTFGEPMLTFLEPTAVGGFRERRVLFKDGRAIDFSFVPVTAIQQMLNQQIPIAIANVFRRGFIILIDKDRLMERWTDSTGWPKKTDEQPSESYWRETTDDFLFHVVLAARKARRGELWVATSSCNGYLQNLLLRLIEWHSKLNGERDTWHRGRFMERWAGPAVLADLPNTLSRYTLADVKRALLANLQFYEKFGRQVAVGFGYGFPDDAYHFATKQVQRVFET